MFIMLTILHEVSFPEKAIAFHKTKILVKNLLPNCNQPGLQEQLSLETISVGTV